MLEFIQPSLTAITSALSILKQGQSLLPESAEVKALQAELETLHTQLKQTEAQVAQTLGHKLCQCTATPTQIMLFKREQNADVCPACGHAEERPGGVSVSVLGPDY